MQVNNGIPADRLVSARWRKSRASNPSGSCVEVAELDDGAVAVPSPTASTSTFGSTSLACGAAAPAALMLPGEHAPVVGLELMNVLKMATCDPGVT